MSKATAARLGERFWSVFNMEFVTPNVAAVSSPVSDFIDGMA
jgi:hypothetical protein